jgi:cysteine desulfurase
MKKRVYLDHNATSPVDPQVLEEMMPYFTERYGNPSSIHSMGKIAREAVEEARENVANLLGAKSTEVIFTGGGSEGNNLALKGMRNSIKEDKIHIVTSAVEHHAVLNTVNYLEEWGDDVSYIGVDKKGRLDISGLTEEITDETRIISIMYANNETGTIFDIPEILKTVKSHTDGGVIFHTDAVQAAGKIPIDVTRDGIDLLTISGHKMGAPKGIGALYIRRGLKPVPLIHGGHHEFNFRAGTENVPGIVALGTAAKIAREHIIENGKRIKKLRDKLEREIIKRLDNVYINGDIEHRLPNTTNLSFGYIEGEGILLNLDLEGISVSSGSACTSKDLTISHVLAAMDVDRVIAQGAVRFSLGPATTEDDIDYVIEKIVPIINRLRELSPLYSKQK